jgi:hypothetical protein
MKHLKIIALFAIVSLLVTAAFQVEPPDWLDLSSVLTWLAGPGAATAMLALGSWLNGRWDWWTNSDQNVKDLITMTAAALVALLATYIPLPVVEQLAQIYKVIATVVLALITTGLYLFGRRRGIMHERNRYLRAPARLQ